MTPRTRRQIRADMILGAALATLIFATALIARHLLIS